MPLPIFKEYFCLLLFHIIPIMDDMKILYLFSRPSHVKAQFPIFHTKKKNLINIYFLYLILL